MKVILLSGKLNFCNNEVMESASQLEMISMVSFSYNTVIVTVYNQKNYKN
jgi:hypothetical protein